MAPGVESTRIVSAPSGKKMTKARGMMIPCAIIIRVVIAWLPLSSPLADEAPSEGAPLAPEVLLAFGPLLASETAAVGAVPPAAVDVAVASRNGLTELPPAALVRSNLNAPCTEWIWRLAAWSLVFKADPSFTDQIQLVDDDFRSMLPPFHELQFEPDDRIRYFARSTSREERGRTSNVGSHHAIDDSTTIQQRHLCIVVHLRLKVPLAQPG